MKKKREININLDEIIWLFAVLTLLTLGFLLLIGVIEPLEGNEAQAIMLALFAVVIAIIGEKSGITGVGKNNGEDGEKEKEKCPGVLADDDKKDTTDCTTKSN